MEIINNLVAQFYAIPAVADIVNSHAILRLATQQYGVPLLGLIILFIVLIMVLILTRLTKKSNKPKPVREKKSKPKKAPRQKAAKPKKVKGPNKAIMAKLAKLPQSTLPLYPVADKRKSLEEALAVAAPVAAPMAAAVVEAPMAAPEPVLDDASLIEGLDQPVMADQVAPEVEVKSFSLNEETAASMIGGDAAQDDFDMPPAADADHEDDFATPTVSDEPVLTARDDLDMPTLDEMPIDDISGDDGEDFDMPSLSAEGTDQNADQGGYAQEGQTIDPVPSLDFDPIEPVPEEDKPEDDGEAIDIPVGSFGSGDADDLSGAAQEKLAELHDRGVTS